MSLKKASLVAMLAVSMAGTPILAQTATPASSLAAPQAARSGADMEDASELRGGFIIPLIALIAVILGLCIAGNICGGDDEDLPTSP